MKIDRSGEVKQNEVEDSGPVEFLHSGCTVLNEAGSNKGKDGGWARGRIINFVGDGSSGKTLLALELASRCFYKIQNVISRIFPPVKSVRIRYNNAEGVMDFPMTEMYGKQFEDGVEWIHSSTVEEMGRDLARTIQEHKPGQFLLYVIDSLDALNSEAAKKRFEDAAKKDKEEDGSYGTEKAKYLSQSFFTNLCDMMSGKDITIVIISQIRQKIGVTFGEKYGRAGGKSLDFYTHQVCWLAEIEKMKRTVLGEERVYGIRVLAKLKRNKVAKPFREAELIILFDYGLDDISSSLAWLYGPKVAKLTFDGIDYSRKDLIEYIEVNKLQDKLADMVHDRWQKIEEALAPNRLDKFA